MSGERARRQRLVLGQRDDEGGARRLGEKRGRGGDIGFAPHAAKTCGYRSRAAAMMRSRVGGRSIASLRS